jgi:hypothetical protein
MQEKHSFALIPLLTLLVASQGHRWERRLLFAGIGICSFVFVGSLALAFDLAGLPVPAPLGPGQTPLVELLFLVAKSVLPVALVVLFVGEDPASLWRAAGG